MEIRFDGKSTEEFFQWMAKRIESLTLPLVEKTVKETFQEDEILTRREVAERILRCSVDTADKYYLYKPGFPYIQRGNERVYPKKAVEKWISENTEYNN